jgi:hypothetical protein
MKFKFSEMYKIKMNIDLTKCREYHGAKNHDDQCAERIGYLTINIGGRDHHIRLCGTITKSWMCSFRT